MSPRPLTTSQRQNLAEFLDALADEYRRTQAHETQHAIHTAATDHPYPSRASTSPAQPNHQVDEDKKPIQPDTPTEAAALNPDHGATQATQLLEQQRQLEHLARKTLHALWLWRPDRNTPGCPDCGHPYRRGENRCRQLINGIPCQSPKARARVCANGCEIPVGASVRNGRCKACDMHWRRHGTERQASLDQLDIAGNVIIDSASA